MSVLAPHRHKGGKRSYQEDPETENGAPDGGGTKTRRLSSGLTTSASRCQPLAERQAYTVSAQTVAALRALFPNMNDQVPRYCSVLDHTQSQTVPCSKIPRVMLFGLPP